MVYGLWFKKSLRSKIIIIVIFYLIKTPATSAAPTGTGGEQFILGSDAGDDFNVGTGKMVVQGNTGNVGIGTSAAVGRVIIKGSGTGATINVQAQDSSGSALMTLLDNGKLGIGSTVPQAKLDVNGTVTATAFSGDGSGLTSTGWTDNGTAVFLSTSGDNLGIGTTNIGGKLIMQGAGIGTNILFQVKDLANSAKLTVLESGNVGLGSSFPANRLLVRNDSNTQDALASGNLMNTTSAVIAQSDSTSSVTVVASGVAGQTGDIFDLKNSGGSVIDCFNASGNMGIGSSVPNNFKLDVKGAPAKFWTANGTDNNATSNGELYVEGDLEVDATIYGNGANITNVSAGWKDDGTAVRLITASDNVGIGTTSIPGSVIIQSLSTGTGITLQTKDSAASAKVTILDNGNVGLGSTNPKVVLDLGGSGQIYLPDGSTSLPAAAAFGKPTSGLMLSTDIFMVRSGSTVQSWESGGFLIKGSLALEWGAGGTINSPAALILYKDAANILTQRDGTNAQTDLVYNTYTSSTNYERGKLEWSSNIFNIGTEKGSGGGSARNMALQTDSTARLTLDSSGNLGIATTNIGGRLIIQGNGTSTGITVETLDSSANAWVTLLDNGNTGIGTNAPLAKFIVTPPSTETITGGATITANACGTIKRISSGSSVTTNTTNTFTAPSSGYGGCCMDVINTGANNITLDNNSNFKSAGAADVVLGSNDTARVCSDGSVWYQVGGTGNN